MKFIKVVLEIIGWLQIVIGTTILSAMPAAAIYIYYQNHTSSIIALCMIAAGFILGAVWATRIWRKHGTIEWLSRIKRVS